MNARKYSEILFLGKFGQKIKIVYLKWILVPRLIRICIIQWWCSIVLFLTGDSLNGNLHFFHFRPGIPFLCEFGPKNQIVSSSLNLVPRLIRICRSQWYCSLFPFSNCKFCLKNQFGIWCYVINLPAVYSQRLEAIGFSCNF